MSNVPNNEANTDTATAVQFLKTNNDDDDDDGDRNKISNDQTTQGKGRLKKLRKRATLFLDKHTKPGGPQQQRTFGLTSYDDLEELRQLSSSSYEIPGPSVLLTNPKKVGWQFTEGTDHRDLLLNLLFYDTRSSSLSSKKRKQTKSDEVIRNINSIPSWAKIHNPVCMSNIAVIEFDIQIPSSSSSKRKNNSLAAMPSFRINQNDNLPESTSAFLKALVSEEGWHGRKALPLFMKLFQGMNYPKQLSDVLLYMENPHHHPKKNKVVDSSNQSNELQRIALHSLILTRQQMKLEDYPLEEEEGDDVTTTRTPHDNRQPEEQLEINHRIQTLVLQRDGETQSSLPCPPLDEARSIVQTIGIPIPNAKSSTNFVKSFLTRKDQADDEKCPQVFALDCEMVITELGMELARVTLLKWLQQEDYSVMLDCLVKPYNPITNYLTEYSGITAKRLENVTTRIEQVQVQMLRYICKEDILIGHSLENDLRALRVIHRNVIDTAVLFRAESGGRKYSLRHLSAVLLHKKIQTTSGHCSEEDAATALTLTLRRCLHGSSFKLYDTRPKNVLHFISDLRKQQQQPPDNNDRDDHSYFITKTEKSLVCIGPTEWFRKHVTSHPSAAHVLNCDSIDCSSSSKAVSAWLKSEKRRAGLLWANMVVKDHDVNVASRRMDDFMSNLIREVPQSTVLLFVFQRDYKNAVNLTQRRKASKDSRSTLGWALSQEEKWIHAMDVCGQCEALWVGMPYK